MQCSAQQFSVQPKTCQYSVPKIEQNKEQKNILKNSNFNLTIMVTFLERFKKNYVAHYFKENVINVTPIKKIFF